MLNLLRDPAWQSIGVFVAVVTAYLAWRFQRTRRALSYQVVAATPIVSPTTTPGLRPDAAGILQILFDNQPVKDAHIVVVELSNSGNVPIRTDDFDGPIRLSYGDGAEILRIEQTRSHPGDLPLAVTHEGNDLVIQPLLLNGGDWLEITVLLTGYARKVAVRGRIAGVKQLNEVPQEDENERVLAAYLTLAILLTFLLTQVYDAITEGLAGSGLLLILVAIAWGLLMGRSGLVMARRARRRLK